MAIKNSNLTLLFVVLVFPLVCFHLFKSYVLKWIDSTELSPVSTPIARYQNDRIFWMCINPPDLKRNLYLYNDNRDYGHESVHFDKSKQNVEAGGRTESQASLNLAREMVKQGRNEKALKIYLHALALDPHNSDLLNSYGEFLETYKKDIVNAEHFYWKVLNTDPFHSKALQNHRRALPLVEKIDRERFEKIESKLSILIQVPDNHPGLRRQSYEQYIRHIHHTTAMEGNTFTLSQTRSFVENRIVITGKSIMEHNEILGMEAAMHFLNSSLLRRMGKFTTQDIREINKRVLGYVDPIGAGVFRSTQVFVGNFVPPRPDQISSLMNEFMEWLNSDDFVESLHPIEAAALAHYKLVYIHPFYDGNGRTSRMLMNLILMLAGYPPTIIPVEHKERYYRYLEAANQGDVKPFIRFIAECTERTLDEYLLSSSANYSRTLPEIGDSYYDGLTIIN